MNWGTKILLVFAVFVSGMLYMVFKASSYNMDLVSTDYYEQELKYQETIDAVKRTHMLSAPVKVKKEQGSIAIELPQEMRGQAVTADVWIYCVANKSKDLKKIFEVSDGKVNMPILPANSGLHEIKISWKMNGTIYYHAEKIKL